MIIFCVHVCMCACMYVVCLFVCPSHTVAAVVGPLLAMTGDVDAMFERTSAGTKHFVRSLVSFSFCFVFFFVRCRRHIIFTLVKCFCCLLLLSFLYYAFYLLFDCECLCVCVCECATVCVRVLGMFVGECWSGFIFDWTLCMYWIFYGWIFFHTFFFFCSCFLLVAGRCCCCRCSLLLPRSTVQRVERSMRSFLFSFPIIASNSLGLT